MPKLGESIMEATILKWHKKPGDAVKMDETVLEIATDKVDSEVPSTAEGVLSEVLFHVNDVVPIGTVIARIKTGAGEQVQKVPENKPVSTADTDRYEETSGIEDHRSFGDTARMQTSNASSNGNRFYSPLVLNIAAQEGV